MADTFKGGLEGRLKTALEVVGFQGRPLRAGIFKGPIEGARLQSRVRGLTLSRAALRAGTSMAALRMLALKAALREPQLSSFKASHFPRFGLIDLDLYVFFERTNFLKSHLLLECPYEHAISYLLEF